MNNLGIEQNLAKAGSRRIVRDSEKFFILFVEIFF